MGTDSATALTAICFTDNKEEDYYIISFEDNTYSLLTKKMISCEGAELRLGAKVKVKTGGKIHMGYLVNFDKQPALTNIF